VSFITLRGDPPHQFFAAQPIPLSSSRLAAAQTKNAEEHMTQVAAHTIEAFPHVAETAAHVAQEAHANPSEEQITRVVFMIIMGAAVLFIAAILFVSHM
jgi:hypothetical protein